MEEKMRSSYLPSQPVQAKPPILYSPSSLVSDGPTASTPREHSLSHGSLPVDRPSNSLKISQLLYDSGPSNPIPTVNSPYPGAQPYIRPQSRVGIPAPILLGARHPQDSVLDSSSISIGHGLSSSQQPHKRAYRQRRKDPSCDACRERKVKCDASESSSCTECSNRNVRCLFTKETNRRMSSIKQVQDLERQLAQAKQQLHQLRMGMSKVDDHGYESEGVSKIPELGCRPHRYHTPGTNHNFSGVCSKMRSYGHGLINYPLIPSYPLSQPMLTVEFPSLPPKAVAEALLRSYYSGVHSLFPVIHWPALLDDYDRIYRAGSLRGNPRGWASVFFAILACGSLHSLESPLVVKGKDYIQSALSLVDFWQDGFSVDSARAAMLISIFLYESNFKSASWVWLGCAVRIAQDLGLHVESGSWAPLDAEIRRRIWWSLYAWERVLVLELGRPLMIHDADCDVELPSSIEEHFSTEGTPGPGEPRATPLLAIVQVLRSVSSLSRAFQARSISAETLEMFERHFRTSLAAFPAEYRLDSDQYLDPQSLSPIIYLQDTRLLLHRHNLSPACLPEMRRIALEQCLAIAHDTVRLLTRCIRSPGSIDPNGSGSGEWRSLLAAAASTVFCTHIWRCILVLLFKAEYHAALVCIRASAAIGDIRVVNNAAGRYISFFLKCLMERQHGNILSLERDEEMMAYVSGDLQTRVDGSWIWQNSHGNQSPSTATPPPTASPSSTASPVRGRFVDPPRSEPSRKEEYDHDWEGWDWVEQMTQRLLSNQQLQQRTAVVETTNSNSRPFYEPRSNRLENTSGSPISHSSNSKMTIASII